MIASHDNRIGFRHLPRHRHERCVPG
jgi:hypothetical protein